MKKLAIVVTHPIQYYVPVFQLLAKEIPLKVFYTGGRQTLNKFDRGFNRQINWDLPLLEGYNYEFLPNVSCAPGSHHFFGIINPNVIKRIKKFKPTTLLIYGWAYFSHLYILKYFQGKVKTLFRGDSILNDKQSMLKKVVKRHILKWVYKNLHIALFVGRQNKEYFKTYGLKPHQLAFVPHAIDNQRFGANRKPEAMALRFSLGIQEQQILILFTGKFIQIKNPMILLKAFTEIAKPDFHLLLVGNGELESQLKQHAFHFNRSANVHFLPFQNQTQMPVVYQACDLFCMPSQTPGETWGLAINEAMAAGKAVLSSDVVAAATDLLTTENGAVFNSDNLEDLKMKLNNLLKNKNCLREMGINGARTINGWSFAKQVNQILKYV